MRVAVADDPVVGGEAAVEMLRRFPTGTRLVTFVGGDHALAGSELDDELGDVIAEFLVREELTG